MGHNEISEDVEEGRDENEKISVREEVRDFLTRD